MINSLLHRKNAKIKKENPIQHYRTENHSTNFPLLFKEGSPGRWVIEGPAGVVDFLFRIFYL
jgi:hypothetical protein